MPVPVTPAPPGRSAEALREQAPFGEVFADHMLVARSEDGRWTDPAIVPFGPLPLSPVTAALHYGQSIFEGFKAHRLADGTAALFRPADNLRRLNRTAARFAMPEVPASIFLDGVADLVRTDAAWIPRRDGGALYIRPIYFAADEALVVRPSRRYQFAVFTCPVGPYFAEPVTLLAEEHYVRAYPGGTGDAKPAGNYGGALLPTRRAQEQGLQNVLWLDASEHRFIEESGLMNVMFVIDGTLVTPPLSGTILPGVTRDSVLALARDLGIPIAERPIAIDELVEACDRAAATEAFGVGTAATVAPIGLIRYRGRDLRFEPGSDSIADRLRSALEDIRTGRVPDRHGWLYRV